MATRRAHARAPRVRVTRVRRARTLVARDSRLEPPRQTSRLVEYYSGIGAVRLALEACTDVTRAVAIDNSDAANAVYAANFGDVPRRGNIEHADADKTLAAVSLGSEDAYDDVVWTMAPPCQPYTRRGKGLASDDPRARSFASVLSAIERGLRVAPSRVFIENVRGFEVSESRRRCVRALRACGYDVKEIIISPTALGIPYTRERYYLMASLRGFNDAAATPHPAFAGRMIDDDGAFIDPHTALHVECAQLDAYVDSTGRSIDTESLTLKPETVRNYWKFLDVVTPASRRCATFTAGYASTVFGGSVLLTNEDLARELDVDANSGTARIRERDVERFVGHLRWFDVEEIKRIHGVRESFSFEVATKKKSLFLLGNSVSVDVVRELLSYLVRAG